MAQDFGVSVTRQAVARYDPTRSPTCPERWKQQFVATRREIIDCKAKRGAAAAIMRARSREKVMLSAVEKMAERVVRRAVRDAEATVAKRAAEADRRGAGQVASLSTCPTSGASSWADTGSIPRIGAARVSLRNCSSGLEREAVRRRGRPERRRIRCRR